MIEDIGKFFLFIFILVIFLFLCCIIIRGFTAPELIETTSGIIMKYNNDFDRKIDTGYYKLQKVDIETVVKIKGE